jgi:hypothetical protein
MRIKVIEEVISPSDAKNIFKAAVDSREQPTLAGRMFKSLRKDKIDFADLQKAWLAAGRPDDTQDIAVILKNQFGFSDKEIKKVYSNVFGASDDEEDDFDLEGTITPAMQKLVDFVKQNGMADQLKEYLKQNYGEELGLTQKPGMLDRLKGFMGKKAVAEDIREIFTQILSEDRSDRAMLIKQAEQTQFGRTKK